MNRAEMSNLYKGPSIDAYYQFQFIWTSGFRRQVFFRYRPIRNKNFLSSPLKSIGQMNRNLVGSIFGKSSLQIAHFVRIRSQTWPPQAILVSDWSISKNLLL
jgi:hypothetical protein